MQEYTAAAFCAVGLEKVLSNELKKLSGAGNETYNVLESGFGRVRFRTGLNGLYRALLSLRAADRLLLETGSFFASDFDSLFEGTGQITWEDFIPRGMGLIVSKVRTSASRLKAETSIQAVVHKAAAQRVCGHYGLNRLPEADRAQKGTGIKQAELRVFVEKDKVYIFLDLSGDPLFKRGYRPAGGIAPLRETTAAAIMLLSGWRRKYPLCDPFCGSGTIIIEAVLYAWDQAPGLGRNFALSDLAIADERTEKTIRKELTEKIDYSRHICINGSDEDGKAITLARTNLNRAIALPEKLSGISGPAAGRKIKGIELNCLPMKDALPSNADEQDTGGGNAPGFIITNPPYGNRIGEIEEAEKRYGDMAVLGKTFPGWHLAVISDHKGFESHFGRKAESCREIKSGARDAWLYNFEKL